MLMICRSSSRRTKTCYSIYQTFFYRGFDLNFSLLTQFITQQKNSKRHRLYTQKKTRRPMLTATSEQFFLFLFVWQVEKHHLNNHNINRPRPLHQTVATKLVLLRVTKSWIHSLHQTKKNQRFLNLFSLFFYSFQHDNTPGVPKRSTPL